MYPDPQLSTALIAVIDDDAATRLLLQEALSEEGYATVVWDAIEDPLAFIERVNPALIVLDVRLTWHDSPWTVIDGLRDGPNRLRIPVIVCTADQLFLNEHGETLRALSCGVLAKPFDLDELFAEVERCLEPSVSHR